MSWEEANYKLIDEEPFNAENTFLGSWNCLFVSTFGLLALTALVAMSLDGSEVASTPHSFSRPLQFSSNTTVFVTRPTHQSSSLVAPLRQKGLRTVEIPMLTIAPPPSFTDLDAAILELDSFDWVVFTSVNGVSAFFSRCDAVSVDCRRRRVTVAAVGEQTAAAVERGGLAVSVVPVIYDGDSLGESIGSLIAPGQRVLLPRVSAGGRRQLEDPIRRAGAELVHVDAYSSTCPEPTEEMRQIGQSMWQQRHASVVSFTSAKTSDCFCSVMPTLLSEAQWGELKAAVTVASIGPFTSEACRRCFPQVHLEANPFTIAALASVLLRHFP